MGGVERLAIPHLEKTANVLFPDHPFGKPIHDHEWLQQSVFKPEFPAPLLPLNTQNSAAIRGAEGV